MQAAELALLERRLSPERLGPYRSVCGDDLAAALTLYRWNAEVSAALATTIGHVEVLLRNALHQKLEAWSARTFGQPRWYLGFWRFLLSRRYDRGLRHPCLHKAFPRRRRVEVFEAVVCLHEARNRIAHLEPMFNRPLADLLQTSLRVADWICPTSRRWIEENSRVTAVIAARPLPPPLGGSS